MKPETKYNLYDFLLSKTNGNHTKHPIRKVFQDLGRENNLLSFRPNSEEHFLVPVDEDFGPEGEQLLLAASSTLELPEVLYVKPNISLVVNEDTIGLSKVSDSQQNEYWLADETGMFLKILFVPITAFSLIRQSPIPVRERRLSLVQQYFDSARALLGMPDATNTDIYEKLGSPTREVLWNAWAKRWPDSFQNFQKNDFGYPPLNDISFKRGTGEGRKKLE